MGSRVWDLAPSRGLWAGLQGGRGVVKEIPPRWFVDLVFEERKAPGDLQRLERCILTWATSVTRFQLICLLGGTDELLTEIPMR